MTKKIVGSDTPGNLPAAIKADLEAQAEWLSLDANGSYMSGHFVSTMSGTTSQFSFNYTGPYGAAYTPVYMYHGSTSASATIGYEIYYDEENTGESKFFIMKILGPSSGATGYDIWQSRIVTFVAMTYSDDTGSGFSTNLRRVVVSDNVGGNQYNWNVAALTANGNWEAARIMSSRGYTGGVLGNGSGVNFDHAGDSMALHEMSVTGATKGYLGTIENVYQLTSGTSGSAHMPMNDYDLDGTLYSHINLYANVYQSAPLFWPGAGDSGASRVAGPYLSIPKW